MGMFNARIGVANPQVGEFQWVDALVDTGAIHSMLPASLLEQTLNLAPHRELVCEVADGQVRSFGYGGAIFRIAGRKGHCPVLFGPDDDYLLGLTTLESLNLIADTANKTLIPAPPPRLHRGTPSR